jgi:hypothetical protein
MPPTRGSIHHNRASVRVGSTVQVSETTINNFTNPVIYTVTAADGTTKAYTVRLTFSGNPAKDITAFSFATPAAVGVINGTYITVTLPSGTNVTNLVATFTTTGASVSWQHAPVSGHRNNFQPRDLHRDRRDGTTKPTRSP